MDDGRVIQSFVQLSVHRLPILASYHLFHAFPATKKNRQQISNKLKREPDHRK
jgi:hypothetical protein